MNPSDYQEIGQYFKESRESLRVSLEEASHALHIRAKYLMALENGDLHDMPGKAYIRGYIKNYAHYLRLDVPAVLGAYGFLLGPKTHDLFIPEPTLQQNLPTRNVFWLCITGLFLLYGFWYFNVHDRTSLHGLMALLPADYAHLLDKPPPEGMDKAWEPCLLNDHTGCFIAAYKQPLPLSAVYDFKPDDITPQKP